MKIGFDGKRATNNLTGLGNYSRSLIGQLSTFFPQNQYCIYSQKVKQAPQIAEFLRLNNVTLKLPLIKTFLWRSFGIKKDLLKDAIQLYHGLSHEIPIGLDIPTVVTIHDLIFIRFPDQFKLIDRLIYRLKCKYACKHADRIVAISERTKLDLVELLGVQENRIDVVYQSCDDSFKRQVTINDKLSVAKQFNLPEKYVLNVGTIETRKNLLTLVKALKNVNEDYKLLVIGKKTPYFTEVDTVIKNLGLESRVIFLQNVPFAALPAIYQMAAVFIYPSIYEGFGIPIIEALYSGTPVVAATGSCLEEAGGPGSLYVSPYDHAGFTQSINNIISDQYLGHNMKTRGLEYVKKFDAEVIATEMMNIYQKIITSKTS